MFSVAVLGFGGRGKIYADNFNFLGVEIAAVCDLSKERLRLAEQTLNCKKLYHNQQDFFGAGKLADVLIIATLDDGHYVPAITALKLGYDLILEKPIALNLSECLEIAKTAESLGRSVTVCHVLRYAPFFVKIKELLDSGSFGKILHMSMSENVGYYHFAHSYVRGPWRNTHISAPIILAKSCHDLDIFSWFMGRKCKSVSSYGDLSFFNVANKPNGSAARCSDCAYKTTCEYSAFKLYLNKEYERLAGLARHGRLGQTDEEIINSLNNPDNPYGKCVFACDNNVYDHQAVNMLFEGGSIGQFTLSAFSHDMSRTLRIYCERGEIYGNIDKQKIHYIIFGQKTKTTANICCPNELYSSHGGGDIGLVKAFIQGYGKHDSVSHIKWSLESHKIGFAAQKSAENNGVDIKLL